MGSLTEEQVSNSYWPSLRRQSHEKEKEIVKPFVLTSFHYKLSSVITP